MAYKAAFKLGHALARTGKNIAIGAAAGALSSGLVSSANDAPRGREVGAIAGGAVGAAASLPFGKLIRAAGRAGGVFARGLKATPSSKAGSALRGAEKAAERGGVIYRRFRGRIVPFRVK